MLVRNTENISIYMQSVLKKMTISSLRGPKRPREFLLRLMSKKRVEAQLEKDNIEAKLQADLKMEESRRKTLSLQAQLEKSKTDRLAIQQELVDNG